jgi:hypothetical protein
MAKHYLDFVGLNTFIYEPVGWDENQFSEATGVGNAQVLPNHLGGYISTISSAGIETYKNYSFSHELPNTASFFAALNIRRNGPYGNASFKQTRVSENPLSRKQRKENIFTMVEEPGPEKTVNIDGSIKNLRDKYGSIKSYIESAVSSRYKPFVIGAATVTSSGSLERFELLSSYGNETVFFNNNQVNNYYDKRMEKSPQYSKATGFYLNGGLENNGSPIDVFEYFKYKECVYPSRIYQYKNYVRQRTSFSFPWRDERDDRSETNVNNNFGSTVHQSKWILDANSAWPAQDGRQNKGGVANVWFYLYGYQNPLDNNGTEDLDFGILQNTYCFGSNNIIDSSSITNLPDAFRIAPLYNRKHTITLSSSVVSPNGMTIEGINSGSTFGNMTALVEVPSGEAKWEAGSQSGLNPFYDSYDKFVDGVRQYGKDYTIIPEFRISDHVETYQTKGAIEEVADLFSLTGALSNNSNSADDDFYKIYSTSEFMKHFEVIKKDHKEFVNPMSITLKCKAVKKFLPYEGFYPAQRSVDLAKQFYDSYKDFVSVSGAADQFGTPQENPVLFQNMMVPMFAPGIFFNTIKSGVAVDYPLIDSNVSLANSYVTQSGDNYYLRNPDISSFDFFDRRIPFEAVVEPEKHLAGIQTFCNEPHIYANNSGSAIMTAPGNKLYRLMAHNFLAETNNFFLKNKRYTTISSKPSSDPNVGLAEANTRYAMRVKMYKSVENADIPKISGSSGFYRPPQYSVNARETFTMYSRPSAFGPPQAVTTSAGGIQGETFLGDSGENYGYTPPYYYGEAWADITFVSTEARKYSMEEIISSASVFYNRFTDNTDGETFRKTYFINGPHFDWGDNITQSDKRIGMHLNSSINLFSQQIDADNSVDPNNPTTRWTIQTKFETPMLNFNHLSASDSITLPNLAEQSVPRGMWHQYGRIEEDSTKGIFLQVDDVPKDYVENYMFETADHKSLADLCGFSTEPAKLGEIADSKTVFEAVVAIPFVEQEGQRYFFRLARNDIARSFGNEADRSRVGDSVLDMVTKLQKYVLPPPLDFINNPEIDPFAMYVFEFKHTFTKQDLANIWQNLYPEIGQTFESAESTISHQLLAHELLGGGAVLKNDTSLDTNSIGNEIPDRVRWMVFKVKQKARINYYEKIYGREDAFSDATVTSQGQNVQVSYNWPYDFFSLVELAKIETEVQFARRPINSDRKVPTIVPVPRQDLPAVINSDDGLSDLFEDAAAGNLPTLNESITITATEPGAEGMFAETSVGSVGRAFNAAVEQTFTEIDQITSQLTPGAGNNPYGATPMGDLFFNVQTGLGPAGSVGIPVASQVAGSTSQMPRADVQLAEVAQGFSTNTAFISTANYNISLYNN